MRRLFTIFCFLLASFSVCQAQESHNLISDFLTKSDTFNQKRYRTSATFATSTYSAFSIGLYFAWYKQYPQSGFHFYNDWNEWQNMDKYGHLYTAYFQALLGFKGAKWVGLSDNNAILTGVLMGTIFQGTLEMMDGFSDQWGFSGPDFAYNTLGVGFFALQEKMWKEQRIFLKVSSGKKPYSADKIFVGPPGEYITLENRANDLFGTNFANRFLKDYNAMSVWACANVKSFLPESSKFPSWLNLAVGYSSENMFGGYANEWEVNGIQYILPENDFPRYHQFYLSLDTDLSRIRTKNKLVNSFFDIFNIFKVPAPAIEYNSLGEFKFHLIYW